MTKTRANRALYLPWIAQILPVRFEEEGRTGEEKGKKRKLARAEAARLQSRIPCAYQTSESRREVEARPESVGTWLANHKSTNLHSPLSLTG